MSVSDLPKSAPSEAAAGVEQIDVRAVNRKTERLQYASRQKIYPKLTSGFFRNVKWLVMARLHGHLLCGCPGFGGIAELGFPIRRS